MYDVTQTATATFDDLVVSVFVGEDLSVDQVQGLSETNFCGEITEMTDPKPRLAVSCSPPIRGNMVLFAASSSYSYILDVKEIEIIEAGMVENKPDLLLACLS